MLMPRMQNVNILFYSSKCHEHGQSFDIYNLFKLNKLITINCISIGEHTSSSGTVHILASIWNCNEAHEDGTI